MSPIVRKTDPKGYSVLPIPRSVRQYDDPDPPRPPRDWREVPMPDGVAALPRSSHPDTRGYPVIYSLQPVPPADPSYADFRVMYEGRVRHIARDRLCAICALPLDYWVFFAGGIVSCSNRWFSDGPMHRDCLEYAFLVCPYLLRGGYKRPSAQLANARQYDPAALHDVGDRIGIYRCRSFVFPAPDGSFGFVPAAPKDIMWRNDLTGHWRRRAKAAQDAPSATETPAGEDSPATLSEEARQQIATMYPVAETEKHNG